MIPCPSAREVHIQPWQPWPHTCPSSEFPALYGWVQLKTCSARQSHFSSHGTQGNLIPETPPSHHEGALRDGQALIYGVEEQEGGNASGIEKPLGTVFGKCSRAGVFAAFCKCQNFLLKKWQNQNHFINSSSFC